MTHWLVSAASRARIPDAQAATIPEGATLAQVWESLARQLQLSEAALAAQVAPVLRLPVADFERVERNAARLIPEKLARKYGVCALRETDRELIVASADPQDFETERDLRFAAGRRINFELAAPSMINAALSGRFSSDSVADKPVSSADFAILLVDDDPMLRLLAKNVLESDGLRVREAGDGAEALALIAASNDIALVITDLSMPGMTGDEVVSRLRGDPRSARLPVVVLTADDDQTMEVRLIDAGVDDYIRKPIDPPRFLARVKAALRRAGVS